jgi:hypothetical protein
MTGTFSWVDLIALILGALSLAVTVAIFMLGRRLSFRQQRERIRELEANVWEVLRPMRTEGRNSKIIVMNVDRYKRGYDGSNELSPRGYSFRGAELIEVVHGGVEVISTAVESYYTANGRRTLLKTATKAPAVLEIGHIPWDWIEDVSPKGDEFDGSAIFFVRHHAAGKSPYNYVTYREGTPVKFGPNNRDYYTPLPELGTRRPRPVQDRWQLIKSLWQARRMLVAQQRFDR